MHTKLLPLFLALFLDAIGFGLVYPLVTELFAGDVGLHMAVGLSYPLRLFYLGLAFLLFPLGSFFSSAWMEELAVHYGKRNVLVLCMGGLTVSFLLMAAGMEFFSIPLLLLGRLLSGVMAGSQPVIQALVVEKSPKSFKTLTFILGVGIVLGPFIGGILSDSELSSYFILATPFYAAAFFALVATVWIALAYRSEPIKKGESINWKRPLQIFYEGLTAETIRLLLVSFVLMQIGFSLFYQLIQIFVSRNFEYPTWKIGLFNGWMGIAIALAIFLHVKNLIKLLPAILFLTGLAVCIPMLFPSEMWIWGGSFLAAGLNMLGYGAVMLLFVKSVNPESQGWVMGILGSLMGAAWILTGFSPNLIPFTGVTPLIFFGGICLILSALLMYLRSRRSV